METLTDIEYLEEFVLSNPELDKLENLLSEFNIFETLNLTHAEIRHSNVIAWLLDPSANHGLGPYFIKQFFKFIVSSNRTYFGSSRLSLFDFELFTYSNVEVLREWNNIDIFVIIEDRKKVAVAIENKIKTSEHSHQLQRYRKMIEREFKTFIPLYIYLTPENVIPSDEEWIPISYDIMTDLLDDLLEYKKNTLNPDIFSFVLQYQTILRRYIVGNSEVEKIAVEIYRKHKQALDIIFQYKPDIYSELNDYLQAKLREENDVIIDSIVKTAIRFTTKDIDSSVDRVGEGWTKSKRIVLFEFYLYDNRVTLRLYIGPGDDNYRKGLQEFFQRDEHLFKLAHRKLGAKWHTVYQEEFLRKSDFEDDDAEAMKQKLEKKFDEFVKTHLPLVHKHFQTHWKK
jgi:hypothetical protein